MTVRKFLTFSLFHFDLKNIAIFCLDFNFMLVEKNVCFFFINDAGQFNSVQDVAGSIQQKDNNSKTKYLNCATILPVIYMFNFPKLYDLIYTFQTAISSSFATLFSSRSISMNLFAWEQVHCILMLQ